MDGPTDASILIRRDSDQDIKMRDLYLLIDDQAERNLAFSERVSVRIGPGDHQIRLTNRLYKAQVSFTLRAGEEAEFEVANVKKRGILNAIAFISGSVMYKPVIRRIK